MRTALADAASHAIDGEALVVSHELPIWMARSWAERRPLVHDPRRRQARLASVTTFTYSGTHLVRVDYAEPCADLVPPKVKKFRPGA
jgi:broad specificity phosphatase PhoE